MRYSCHLELPLHGSTSGCRCPCDWAGAERSVARRSSAHRAASGFGEATCHLLAKQGIRHLVAADIAEDRLRTVSEQLQASGTHPQFQITPIVVDIGNEDSVLAMFARIRSELGRLDYVSKPVNSRWPTFHQAVNNAGILKSELGLWRLAHTLTAVQRAYL
jgi:NAD(P)-dependent dehydrogenase (short-subunit alcohol dehydrogenase family)